MTTEYFEVEQGSQEWFDLRTGSLSASMFPDIFDAYGNINATKKGDWTQKVLDWVETLASERIAGTMLRDDISKNFYVKRGIEQEELAVQAYANATASELKSDCGCWRFTWAPGRSYIASPDFNSLSKLMLMQQLAS